MLFILLLCGLALNTFFIKKLYNALFLNQYTKPNPVTSKKDSPFANFEWHENNCYIDATLQILYEDKEFRQYVDRQEKNFEYNSTCTLSKENAEIAYKSLYQIFDDMDNYRGKTVPHNSARQDFEQALGHSGSADANLDMFAKIYPCGAWIICDNNETGKVEITGQDTQNIHDLELQNLKEIEYERDSLWFVCNATSKDDRQSLPMKLTFKNNKKFKLKGVVVYVPGHYNAYKTDENGQWYYIDDYKNCNHEIHMTLPDNPYQIYTQSDFKAVHMGYDPETNKCSYAPGVQLAYYQAV